MHFTKQATIIVASLFWASTSLATPMPIDSTATSLQSRAEENGVELAGNIVGAVAGALGPGEAGQIVGSVAEGLKAGGNATAGAKAAKAN